MTKRVDFSLVLACYNEEPIFQESVGEILRVLNLSTLAYEIIFVDDSSHDNTLKLIKEFCKKHKNCRFLSHATNKGRGKTVRDGIDAARGEIVGFIDIDLEVSPVYIPVIVDLIKNQKADFVIGKRIYRGGIASWFREVLSLGYQKLVALLLDTGGLDTESGYKFFRRKKIIPLLPYTTHPHWFWDTEVTVVARKLGLRVAEHPVLFTRRIDKVSSVRVVSDTIDYLVNIWKFRKKVNQLPRHI